MNETMIGIIIMNVDLSYVYAKFHLARLDSTRLDSTRLDTFDVSSPCILAVSS